MRALSIWGLFAALLVAQPAMAAQLTSNDLDFAFGGTSEILPAGSRVQPSPQLASLQPLSIEEMQQTEGSWLSFVATGVGAGVYYAGYVYVTGSGWNWGEFGGAVVGGAVAGGVTAVAGPVWGGAAGGAAHGAFVYAYGAWWPAPEPEPAPDPCAPVYYFGCS